MDPNTQPQTQPKSDLIKEAEKRFYDRKREIEELMAKTDALEEDIKKGINEAAKQLEEIDAELSEFEKQAVNKMDAAVLEFIAEDEEEMEDRL